MKDLIFELEREINKFHPLSPEWADKELVKISFYYEFEAYGVASETWERVWKIELPFIQGHWENIRGELVPNTVRISSTFYGRDLENLIASVINYLRRVKEGELKYDRTW